MMPDTRSKQSWFQWSIRGLLVCMALVALAIVSLRLATEGWRMAVLTVLFVVFAAAVILAVVERGPRQAFAIGLALTITIYGSAIVLAGIGVEGRGGYTNREFNPAAGRLPTTRLMRPLFDAMAEVRWTEQSTGQVLSDSDAQKYQADPVAWVASPQGQRLSRGGFPGISMSETPSRSLFMTIGHTWWAILLGYCGGLFARFVYVRRTREQSSSNPPC